LIHHVHCTCVIDPCTDFVLIQFASLDTCDSFDHVSLDHVSFDPVSLCIMSLFIMSCRTMFLLIMSTHVSEHANFRSCVVCVARAASWHLNVARIYMRRLMCRMCCCVGNAEASHFWCNPSCLFWILRASLFRWLF